MGLEGLLRIFNGGVQEVPLIFTGGVQCTVRFTPFSQSFLLAHLEKAMTPETTAQAQLLFDVHQRPGLLITRFSAWLGRRCGKVLAHLGR